MSMATPHTNKLDDAKKAANPLEIDTSFTPVEYDPQYVLQVNALKK